MFARVRSKARLRKQFISVFVHKSRISSDTCADAFSHIWRKNHESFHNSSLLLLTFFYRHFKIISPMHCLEKEGRFKLKISIYNRRYSQEKFAAKLTRNSKKTLPEAIGTAFRKDGRDISIEKGKYFGRDWIIYK